MHGPHAISLIIPVFNERFQLEASVRTLLDAGSRWSGLQHSAPEDAHSQKRTEPAQLEFEIVVADNGSTDGTTEIAKRLARSFVNVRHLFLREKGRGRALRQAWMNSNAQILAYMDVDLSTDISFFPLLIEPLATGNADVATGSRLLRPEWTKRGLKRESLSRCYNLLLRAVFRGIGELTPKEAKFSRRGLSFSDAQCGFKAITKKAANELLPLVEDNEWFFDTELLLLAEYLGYRIHDLPVRWTDDSDSRVKIVPTIIKDLKGIFRMKKWLKNKRSLSVADEARRRSRSTSAAEFVG